MIRFGAWLCSLVMLAGCGRYFDGPIQPAPQEQQEADMVIKDDGLITYSFERLEIGLRPMTDAELNRKFPQHSTQDPYRPIPILSATGSAWAKSGRRPNTAYGC